MREEDIKLLERHGWIVVCESPKEIENDLYPQSTATGFAVDCIIDQCRMDEKEDDLVSREELLHQGRRVRNFSNPDEVYYAVPVNLIANDSETPG